MDTGNKRLSEESRRVIIRSHLEATFFRFSCV